MIGGAEPRVFPAHFGIMAYGPDGGNGSCRQESAAFAGGCSVEIAIPTLPVSYRSGCQISSVTDCLSLRFSLASLALWRFMTFLPPPP